MLPPARGLQPDTFCNDYFILKTCLACSQREYSASSGEIDEKMSASSFAPGSDPGLVGISGWQAKETKAGEWIEYDTSHNPRIVVESRTLLHK